MLDEEMEMVSEKKYIYVEKRDAVAKIVLNRPEKKMP